MLRAHSRRNSYDELSIADWEPRGLGDEGTVALSPCPLVSRPLPVMPLTFNIRHLEAKELHLEGELPSGELEIELHDELIHPAEMLEYDLEVEHLEGAALVQGQLSLDI